MPGDELNDGKSLGYQKTLNIADPAQLADVKDPAQTFMLRAAELDLDQTVLKSPIGATPPPTRQFEANTHLRDVTESYVLLQVIGEGGQGEVWEATQLELGRTVAVKKAKSAINRSPDFLREAYTTANLEHPNIVPVHALGLVGEKESAAPALVMKRIRGRSWNVLIKAARVRDNFALDDFLSVQLPIFVQVVNAVSYAHSKGFIHRDLKPSQVVIGDFGEVQLLDWGLAIRVGDSSTDAEAQKQESLNFPAGLEPHNLVTASSPAGSPAYMAPEQTDSSASRLGIHTDIYLLGAILYELLAGRPPHPGDSAMMTLVNARQNVNEPFPPGLPPELVSLAQKCLETDPAMRISSAAEIRNAVEAFMSGATNKLASERITTDLLQAPELSGYEALSGWSHKLDEAGRLWPKNPKMDSAREKLLKNFVGTALQSGHLLVAQIQTDRVTDPATAAELQKQISARQSEMEQHIALPRLFGPKRLGLGIALCGAVAALLLAVIFEARHVLEAEVQNKAASLAAFAAKDISPRDLAAVDAHREIYSGEFQRILNKLSVFRRVNSEISHIYTATPISERLDSWYTLADADTVPIDWNRNGKIEPEESGNPPGHILAVSPPAMRLAYQDRKAHSGYVTYPWGAHYVSGYAPIIDPASGNVIAVLGVALNAQSTESKMRAVKIAGMSALVVVTGLIGISLFALLRSRDALTRTRLLQEQIRRQNAEVRGKKIHLG